MLASHRSAEHHEAGRGRGLKRLKVFHQTRPNEAIIVYMESDDIAAAMRNRASSDHEFDEWFGNMIEEITGYHPDRHFHEPPSELLLDWHEDLGHKHRAEH
ncbi:MAG TPA: hypothetical protein VK131_05425 [Candidatus Acidoferrales bacterium]|nr:hypothetical protein [Candidatus Acidoferrales bacterium]